MTKASLPAVFLLMVIAGYFLPNGIACGARNPAYSGDKELWVRTGAEGGVQINFYFFWSETCPYCARALPVVRKLTDERPWLKLYTFDVAIERNRDLYQILAAHLGLEADGVPAFFLCGQMVVGFDSAAGVGAYLANLADDCKRLSEKGRTAQGLNGGAGTRVTLPLFGKVDAASLSLPLLTLALGGVDAFNPCAFFVLLFLMSLLVHAHSRGRMLLIGGIFVLCSGALYFAFMAAWLNLFLVMEGMSFVTVIAGLVAVLAALINIKDYFFFRRGPSLSIPEAAKPGLLGRMRGLITAGGLPALLGGTVALAVAANSYELLCTSGLPLLYTRILTLKELPAAGYYLYLLLYNVVYVLPLLAIVLVFTATLGARKLTETQGRLLKLLSGLMMLELGGVLLAAPGLLDSLPAALALPTAAAALTALAWLWERRRA